MTLKQAGLGREAKIAGFTGLDEAEKIRLGALGLREGASVTKLMNTPLRDPVECAVGPQLLTIESWLLERIIVEL